MGTLAAGIKEIFATAKTTGSNVMLCGNDGTPDGHMTMANLASVLGGLNTSISANIDDSYDLNNLTDDYAKYSWGETQPVNSPCKWGILYNLKWSPGITLQVIVYQSYASQHIYYRTKELNAFGGWREFSFDVPTFYNSYANLGDLANALGVINNTIATQELIDVDLNTLTSAGCVNVKLTDTVTYKTYNFPAEQSECCVITLRFGKGPTQGADMPLQIAFSGYSGKVYFRYKWGIWGDWS